jgi:hypothetical protein
VTEAEVPDSRWLEPAELLRIARRDVTISGDEPLEAAIMREPSLLIRLGRPSTRPLDLNTYRIRRARWERGEGPRLTGMGEFMAVLESLTEPAGAVAIQGERTTYQFLLDPGATRVPASVAIDPPAAGNWTH